MMSSLRQSLNFPAALFSLLSVAAASLILGCGGIDDTPEFQMGRTWARLWIVAEALSGFKAKMGHYPTSEQGLEVLTQDSSAGGPILREVPKDGWGRALAYKLTVDSHGESFGLYSLGPNGVDEGGLGDDVSFGSEEAQKERAAQQKE